jgi:hypothetical protein
MGWPCCGAWAGNLARVLAALSISEFRGRGRVGQMGVNKIPMVPTNPKPSRQGGKTGYPSPVQLLFHHHFKLPGLGTWPNCKGTDFHVKIPRSLPSLVPKKKIKD